MLFSALKGARTYLRVRRDKNARDGTRDESARCNLLPLTFNLFPGCASIYNDTHFQSLVNWVSRKVKSLPHPIDISGYSAAPTTGYNLNEMSFSRVKNYSASLFFFLTFYEIFRKTIL